VKKPSKARSSSYQLALLRSGAETRRGNIVEARQILTDAIQRSDLDWPEMVYEALTQLESIHGQLDTIKDSQRIIERESEKLAKRRQKAVEDYQAYQPVETVEQPTEQPVEPVEVSRDREHATVIVFGIDADIDTARLESFFAEVSNPQTPRLMIVWSSSGDNKPLSRLGSRRVQKGGCRPISALSRPQKAGQPRHSSVDAVALHPLRHELQTGRRRRVCACHIFKIRTDSANSLAESKVQRRSAILLCDHGVTRKSKLEFS
jgi:hypothetical protein